VKTYQGRCHCGAVRFTVKSEPIEKGLRCNCSICVRKGVLLSARYYTPAELTFSGREGLTLYAFGDRMVNHWFCRACGVHPFTELTARTDRPGHCRINLGCLDDLERLALPVEVVDGRSF
jgi:hypothetical protein